MSNQQVTDHVQSAFDAATGRPAEKIARLLIAVKHLAIAEYVDIEAAATLSRVIERSGR